MTPELLIAGNIAKDVTADGWRPGGGVLYAAAQARRLGVRVAAVTASGPEVDPASLLPDVEWHVLPSGQTTTFENFYEGGRRRQRLLATGARIRLADLPGTCLRAPLALLTPVFHEIEVGAAGDLASRGAVVGVGAQGWLRRLEGETVRPVPFDAAPAWLAGDVVFVSEEDVEEPESVSVWRGRVGIVVLTRGRRGCTVWDESGRHDVSAASVQERDPTGAGDVFAAAFLVRYHETGDVTGSARFATAAGALSVRGEGFASVAGREEIESLLERGQVKVA